MAAKDGGVDEEAGFKLPEVKMPFTFEDFSQRVVTSLAPVEDLLCPFKVLVSYLSFFLFLSLSRPSLPLAHLQFLSLSDRHTGHKHRLTHLCRQPRIQTGNPLDIHKHTRSLALSFFLLNVCGT